jgi:hypothetical protein
MSVLGEGARVKAQVRSTPFVRLSRNKRNVPIIVAAQNKNQGTLYLIRYGVRPSVRRGSRQAVKEYSLQFSSVSFRPSGFVFIIHSLSQ